MFILVPLSILVISLASLLFIYFKKFSYLKKLSTDPQYASVSTEIGFFQFLKEMFPEIFDYFHRLDVASHKYNFLVEFEKFLRKARLVFLRIDNVSSSLIHKVRATHEQEAQKSQEKEEAKKEAMESVVIAEAGPIDDPYAGLKKREYELIIEIAKDPKNPLLYRSLGDIYTDMKQWHYAQESYSSSLKLDPKMRGIKRKLELATKMLGSQSSSNPNVS